MPSTVAIRHLVGIALASALLWSLACGPAEVATPTPVSAPGVPTATPTIFVPVVPVLPTATPTPLPGVAAIPTPTATPLPAAERPKYGGIVRVPGGGTSDLDIQGLQPGIGWGSQGLIGNYLGQLIRVSPKDWATVEGDLAESWSLSPDGTAWKFKIRPGVLDHEGNPYTVEDAYWQMIRYVERPNGVPGNRQSCIRSYVKKIWDENKKPLPNGGAEITGPNELTIRLSGRKPSFVPCFAGVWTAFAPSKYTKPIDTAPGGKYRDLNFAKGEAIGTGPFKIKSLEIDNFTILERFDKYFRPGLPYLDEVHMLNIPELSTQEAAFGVGKLDIMAAGTNSNLASAKRLGAQLGKTAVFPPVLVMGFNTFDLNVRVPPFGPPDSSGARNIRFAIQLAVDRQEINDLIFEGIGHISTPYFVGWDWIYAEKEWLEKFSGYDSTPTVKARDIAQAQKLMQAQGYGPTNRLKFRILTSATGDANKQAQLVAKQLEKTYMDVAVIGGDHYPILQKGDFEMGTVSTAAPFADPDAYNTSIHWAIQEGGRNFSGWTNANPKWLELFNKQVSLASDVERAPVLREMAKILYEEAPTIGLIRATTLMGYRTYLKGWVPPPYHSTTRTLENVWISK